MSTFLDYYNHKNQGIHSSFSVYALLYSFIPIILFLNAAVELETNLTPFSLLLKLQDIEKEMGRINKTKNQEYEDRIIDIDILMYDDLKIDTFELSLPHPSMWERPFVLKPLVEIYPDILNQKPMTNMK